MPELLRVKVKPHVCTACGGLQLQADEESKHAGPANCDQCGCREDDVVPAGPRQTILVAVYLSALPLRKQRCGRR